jgi:hypothetical protein
LHRSSRACGPGDGGMRARLHRRPATPAPLRSTRRMHAAHGLPVRQGIAMRGSALALLERLERARSAVKATETLQRWRAAPGCELPHVVCTDGSHAASPGTRRTLSTDEIEDRAAAAQSGNVRLAVSESRGRGSTAGVARATVRRRRCPSGCTGTSASRVTPPIPSSWSGCATSAGGAPRRQPSSCLRGRARSWRQRPAGRGRPRAAVAEQQQLADRARERRVQQPRRVRARGGERAHAANRSRSRALVLGAASVAHRCCTA